MDPQINTIEYIRGCELRIGTLSRENMELAAANKVLRDCMVSVRNERDLFKDMLSSTHKQMTGYKEQLEEMKAKNAKLEESMAYIGKVCTREEEPVDKVAPDHRVEQPSNQETDEADDDGVGELLMALSKSPSPVVRPPQPEQQKPVEVPKESSGLRPNPMGLTGASLMVEAKSLYLLKHANSVPPEANGPCASDFVFAFVNANYALTRTLGGSCINELTSAFMLNYGLNPERFKLWKNAVNNRVRCIDYGKRGGPECSLRTWADELYAKRRDNGKPKFFNGTKGPIPREQVAVWISSNAAHIREVEPTTAVPRPASTSPEVRDTTSPIELEDIFGTRKRPRTSEN
jgi:hypothetical protein